MANVTESSLSQHSPDGQLFMKKSTVYYILVGTEVLAGLVGNSLFLLALRKARNCKANNFTLMASLSAVDILTSLTLGVGFLREFLLTNFASQEMMCQYGLFISASSISCNALHILCMAVDRYAAIAFPHRSVLLFLLNR